VKDVMVSCAMRYFSSNYLLVKVDGLPWGGHGWGFVIVFLPIISPLCYSMVALLVALFHFLHGYILWFRLAL